MLTPGLHAGVPEAAYRADPGVNVSLLKVGVEGSAADMLAYTKHPDPPTDAMKFGTAVHAYLLEPERFRSTWVVKPKIERRSNAGKADDAAWDAEHVGCTVIDADDLALIEGMGRAIEAHPVASKIIHAAGDREVVAIWNHSATGVRCKARIDYANLAVGLLVDVKSAADSRPAPWRRQAARLHYAMQVAWYQRGYSIAADMDTDFVFIVPGSKATNGRHIVGVYSLEPEWVEAGERMCNTVLAGWLECVESGVYPDHCDNQTELRAPTWALLESPVVCPSKKYEPGLIEGYNHDDPSEYLCA